MDTSIRVALSLLCFFALSGTASAQTCLATVNSVNLSSSSYSQPNASGGRSLTLVWIVNYTCPGGTLTHCNVCTQVTVSSRTNCSQPFAPDNNFSNQASWVGQSDACGATYNLNITTTLNLAAGTYYNIVLSAAPLTGVQNGGVVTYGCPLDPKAYTSDGPFSATGSQRMSICSINQVTPFLIAESDATNWSFNQEDQDENGGENRGRNARQPFHLGGDAFDPRATGQEEGRRA